MSETSHGSDWKKIDVVFLHVFHAAIEILQVSAPGIKETMRIAIANRIAMRAAKLDEDHRARMAEKKDASHD